MTTKCDRRELSVLEGQSGEKSVLSRVRDTLGRSRVVMSVQEFEVPSPRLERGTTCLEGRCSIQLSYEGVY